MTQSFNTLLPFHRQLLPKLLTTLLVAFALSVFIALFFINKNSQLNHQLTVALPQKVSESTANEMKLRLTQLLLDLRSVQTAEDLPSLHQKFLSVFTEYQKVSRRRALAAISTLEQEQIARISANSQRNEALRRDALLLIEALLPVLNEQVDFAEQQKQKHYQQVQSLVNNEKNQQALTESLAYINYVQHSVLLTQVMQKTAVLTNDLSTLNLQTELMDFEQLAELTQQLFAEYHQIPNNFFEQLPQPEISQQLSQLEALLINDQRLVAKWRGYLRLYHEYHQQLGTLVADLTLANQTNGAQSSQNRTSDEGVVLQWLAKANIKLSTDSFYLGLTLVILALALTLITLIWRLSRLVQTHNYQLISSLKNAVEDNEIEQIASYEQQAVIELFTQLKKPKHSERDYQQMRTSLLAQLEAIARHNQVVFWQLNDGKIDFHQERLAYKVVGEKPPTKRRKKNQSWRARLSIFDAQAQRQLIRSINHAKRESAVQIIDVYTTSKVLVTVVIIVSEGKVFGTLANADQKAQLKIELESQGQQTSNQQDLALTIAEYNQKYLGNMLVQTMLQSQNAAIVSGVSSQPVYRQLARMFDWLRQQQLTARLLVNTQARQEHDVQFAEQVYAIVLNSLTEAQLSQNDIKLFIEPNVIEYAKLDIRLFQRLLQTFCRIALKEQFKGQLSLTLSAVDQNPGQQIIQVQANVKLAKKTTRLPEHINRLINDDFATEQLGNQVISSENYFTTLLKIQHGEQLNAELTDNGFKLSFQLAITTTNLSLSAAEQTSLHRVSCLLLTTNKQLKQTLSSYIGNVEGELETLAQAELLANQYDIAELTRKPKQCIVLASDQINHLASVEQYIASLPNKKQPKLLVMQPTGNSAFNRTGFYSHADSPICQQEFVRAVHQLVKGKAQNNLVVASQVFEGCSFQTTQVEVLLAVQAPSEHLMLWRLLHWFGMQVKVVAHADAMIKHWQSGRYLILINEFEQSPLIELAAGRSIPRGVFNFAQEEVIELSEQQAELTKHWHFGTMPEVTEVKQLTKLFNPWLKTVSKKTKTTHTKQKEDEIKQSSHSERLFSDSLIEQLPPAFDLETYAQNQGSPELAVFMLDEYLDNISQLIEQLIELIDQHQATEIQACIAEINLIASIIAAKGLNQISQQLEQALLNSAFDNMHRLAEQAKLELSAIKIYADAI